MTKGITLGLALLLAFAAPAMAQGQTVRASDDLALRSGPGSAYPIVATLLADRPVQLDRCTRGEDWCLVVVDGIPYGWARGSYLIGNAAKRQASPPEPIFDLFGPFGPSNPSGYDG